MTLPDSNDATGKSVPVDIAVHFIPKHRNYLPPRLVDLRSTLREYTFATSLPLQDISDEIYREVALTNNLLGGAESNPLGCGSKESSGQATSDPTWTFNSTGDAFLTISSSINMPKNLIPTFHSCLMSRTYCLHLSLKYRTDTRLGITSSLQLDMPLLIHSPKRPPPRTSSRQGQTEQTDSGTPGYLDLTSNLTEDFLPSYKEALTGV
jgi:hypothetical protein